jgi:hypothetical protein
MAYTCRCGYSTQKGGKAVDRHERSCGMLKQTKEFRGHIKTVVKKKAAK